MNLMQLPLYHLKLGTEVMKCLLSFILIHHSLMMRTVEVFRYCLTCRLLWAGMCWLGCQGMTHQCTPPWHTHTQSVSAALSVAGTVLLQQWPPQCGVERGLPRDTGAEYMVLIVQHYHGSHYADTDEQGLETSTIRLSWVIKCLVCT